jgi:hypothetical protein
LALAVARVLWMQQIFWSFGSWRTARYWCNTLDEYQKYFEKDSTRKTFPENNYRRTDTESFNRGIKEKYETHHKVQIKERLSPRSNYHNGILLIVFFRQSYWFNGRSRFKNTYGNQF